MPGINFVLSENTFMKLISCQCSFLGGEGGKGLHPPFMKWVKQYSED